MQTFYFSKIIKVGSSHGVVIPKNILEGFKWERGDLLAFGFAEGNNLVLHRLTDKEVKQLRPDIKFN